MASGDMARIQLLLDHGEYIRVKHAAVDEGRSANAWIRDAVGRKLGDETVDPALERVASAWASCDERGRALISAAADNALDATRGRARRAERLG